MTQYSGEYVPETPAAPPEALALPVIVARANAPLTGDRSMLSLTERDLVAPPAREAGVAGAVNAEHSDHGGPAHRAIGEPRAVFPTWRAIIWTTHRGRGQQAWEAWLHDERIWGSGRTEAEALGNLLRWHDQAVMQALTAQLGVAEVGAPTHGQLSVSSAPAVVHHMVHHLAPSAAASHAFASGSSRDGSGSQPGSPHGAPPGAPADDSGALSKAIGEEAPD